MIIAFAGDFIGTGDSMEQKQSRLNAVCTARNIANLPKHQRCRALQRYLQRYREENQGVEDVLFLRKDMEQPIKQKIKKFGQVEKPIVHAEIRQDGARYSIFAVSVRMEEGG
jgi:hypothetical protein